MPIVWRAWCPLKEKCHTKQKRSSFTCKSTESFEDLQKKMDHHLQFSSYHEIKDSKERELLVTGMTCTCEDEASGMVSVFGEADAASAAAPAAKRPKRGNGGGVDVQADGEMLLRAIKSCRMTLPQRMHRAACTR